MDHLKMNLAKCLVAWCVLLGLASMTRAAEQTPPQLPPAGAVQNASAFGYLTVAHSKSPASFNMGYSVYTAAWPLLQTYPGHQFQSGLFGTWMFAQYDGPAPQHMYSDVEGGLGWWRGTRFPTVTPKFVMGGVGPNFCAIANGPGSGAGAWSNPRGLYGVAQLSPWLLFPPDGLDIRQGTCGQLVGYGYLALPLLAAKPITDGQHIPTGDHCWTLFLNTHNFKGPVAFFTPYFWSHTTVKQPELAGKLLDSRPAHPNKSMAMETQYVPAVMAQNARGQWYARLAPTWFPIDAHGDTVLMHRSTVYNKNALWNAMQRWFSGGAVASGLINPAGAEVQQFTGGRQFWKIPLPHQASKDAPGMAWNSFATVVTPDPDTFGYRWHDQLVTRLKIDGSPLVRLPEYYRLTAKARNRPEWTAIPAQEVPAETRLASVHFGRRSEPPPQPYTTPDAPESCWKTPGPVAGPFKAHLGDGSIVTYYWYRFADQPAVLNAGLSTEERQALQRKVEKIHRLWTRDREYLAPPTVGTLADLDPALIVTPPKGLQAGYVPIVTRQEIAPQESSPHTDQR